MLVSSISLASCDATRQCVQRQVPSRPAASPRAIGSSATSTPSWATTRSDAGFRFDEGSWVVESSIRVNGVEGEDELVGLATRYAVDNDELVGEVRAPQPL
jgi:hypothetical protein